MSLLLVLTFLLIPVGPAAIVGALTLIASIDCPELLRRPALRPGAARPSVRRAVWA